MQHDQRSCSQYTELGVRRSWEWDLVKGLSGAGLPVVQVGFSLLFTLVLSHRRGLGAAVWSRKDRDVVEREKERNGGKKGQIIC